MAYAEDEAGGLMNPRYARVRADVSVDEAISYLRKQAREHLENVYYVYVNDSDQRLVGVVSLRELFAAAADRTVRDIMSTELVTARGDMDQEELGRLFAARPAGHPGRGRPGALREHRDGGRHRRRDQEEATEDIRDQRYRSSTRPPVDLAAEDGAEARCLAGGTVLSRCSPPPPWPASGRISRAVILPSSSR